ncbi:hypothetical protein TanjilG_20643 [Lupinus angustifolius]|uniref:Inactive poly [ADP-ribose] polymerase RCD1-like n=1 Tax=Lupinus angustifolius TaxID=3871 RepID=A0A4P1QRF0_LUPAN|nr:PREDICTED: inactive poly [ADP-ribose] polymerase RCD1-like [Lupinus angustifolius]XP_019423794.1 PREDICTED: inactive poly [ADP-ribose] polymerase RCD1-like [Lupinus angustifolius]XP_019423795.1 PREDICTED: inactive poly [ADP-ribose] polymerase RCD1-like [Lupinus angustifolius]XP_019423796.1 PREDICTED: inactive poly [ADP-ribose] polymerase RCD1-like [Lupinus angustifolius]OIV92981.1 hypothetical protein TanjilG_20643 [Lupinus angustifolius]
MEYKIAKASDRVAINLKRKRSTRCAAYLDGASRTQLRHWPSSTTPTGKVVKRMRCGRSKSKLTSSGTHTGQSLVRRYLNYRKSGRPERLLFYKNGEWLDFPTDVVKLVKKDLVVKKEVVEVESNGYHLLLDFVHMYKVDLKTGLQQPIAWIDEAGCCFFPDVFVASDEEPYDFSKQESGKNDDSYEIKLHLEIDLNGVDGSKLMECSGDSNALVEPVQIDSKQSCGPYDVQVESNINKRDHGNVGVAIQLNQDMGLGACTESVYGNLDTDTVRRMFLTGMSSFGITDIIEIYRCSSMSMPVRLEVFLKQAEITKRMNGNANVQYAWLASSKGELSTIMEDGLGHCRLSACKCTYGIGVHLSAVTCPYTSAQLCDNDENGVRHLVFCRVIMGNMELLRPGTDQLRPSTSAYENGVDDVQSPTHYVVWNMNMNTHIYPEFVVSFKVSSAAEAHLCGSHSKNNSSVFNSADQGSTVDPGQAASTRKVPTSPFLPLPLLFDVIRNKVLPEDMELIKTHYEQFVSKQISRDNFVQKLRMIVGDTLLRATILGLQMKKPSAGELRDSNKEED